MTPNQGPVPAFHGPLRQLTDERLIGQPGAGHHQQARRAPVETMDDSGPGRITDFGHFGVVGQQARHHGAVVVTGPRMHDQVGRLVHYHHVLVGEHHRNLNGRIGLRGDLCVRFGHIDLDQGAFGQLHRPLGRHHTVDGHRAVDQQNSDLRARQPGDHGHHSVQPLASQDFGDVL